MNSNFVTSVQLRPVLTKERFQNEHVSLPSFNNLIRSLSNSSIPPDILLERKNYSYTYSSPNINDFNVLSSSPTRSSSENFANLDTLARISTMTSYAANESLSPLLENNIIETISNLMEQSINLTMKFQTVQKSIEDLKNNEKELDESSFNNKHDKFKHFILQFPDDISVLYRGLSDFAYVLDEIAILKSNYFEDESNKNVEQETQVPSNDETNEDLITDIDRNQGEILKAYRSTEEKKVRRNTLHSHGKPVKRNKVKKQRITKVKKPHTNSHCSQCHAGNTPEWRRGPNGSRTLCNACGLFYSKLAKKFGNADGTLIFNFKKTIGDVNDRTVPTFNDKRLILQEFEKSSPQQD
ncbi:uncharacterized protein RJT20DRAFT_1340 [Scheffersomyces xylosifermentans]|uniref:uncharacterized protein n=1 Tax=Scheffersomyces xylosifermentans TaxID=1304137 RepID=UPI00315CF80A